MKTIENAFLLFATVLLSTTAIFAQRELGARPTSSGGPLIYEQAAYDVQQYDITAQVFPDEQKIIGETLIASAIVSPTIWFVFDLDTPYKILSVSLFENEEFVELKFKRKDGKIWASLPRTMQPGEAAVVKVAYEGKPRIAPNPPWVGGFMWEKTADGSHWIVNANQNDGADLWFPVKDHPSDEANQVELHITVPENLYVASVGKLGKTDQNQDDTKTYHWKMESSINNYNIVVNIAPYKIVEQNYKSIDGTVFPIRFYALPESAGKAKDIVNQTAKFLAFYEKFLGPYPYRSEKLGIAETPHLGMEHSTIIAYGNKFKNGPNGFDTLMLHELGHEWWGNLVTASDWRDFWIHEGFQSYMDTLYLEQTKGQEAYLLAMRNRMKNTRNKQAVAPRESKMAFQVYMAEPDYVKSDGDIYGKGASVLHTLRYLIGDEAFFRALRRMAYPTKKIEAMKDGSQSRFVTTDDFKNVAEKESKMDLDWFFEMYLRQPFLPRLNVEQVENNQGRMSVNLKWETPNGMPFNMPVEVKIGDDIRRISFEKNFAVMPIQKGQEMTVDPNGWVLKAR